MDAESKLSVARAEALFVSDASISDQLTRQQATALISKAVRTYHGVRGCAAEVAAAYGDHPDVAPSRMRWACAVVDVLYPTRRPRVPSCAGRAAAHELAA